MRVDESLADGPARMLRAAVVIAAGAVAAQTLALVANELLPSELHNLNADLEMTPWSWASSCATFSAALAATLAGVLGFAPRRAFLLAGLLACLSLDDAIALHERLARQLVDWGVPSGIDGTLWPFVLVPVFTGTALVLLQLTRSSPPEARRATTRGLGLLLVALAAEAVWGFWYWSGADGDWANTIEVAVEEGAELAGWILVAAGTAITLIDRLVRATRTEPAAEGQAHPTPVAATAPTATEPASLLATSAGS